MERSSSFLDPPAIVGCGLTGLAISRALDRAGVDHLLIGDAPEPGRIRLGESLNLEGTLDLEAYFPELAETFHPKAAVVAHVGDEAISCDLELARRRPARILYRLLGYTPPRGFLHVDRVAFDPAAFASVTTSPRCRHLPGRVGEVGWEAGRDTVTELRLDDGTVLRPRFVYDATNHVRLLPRAMDLPVRFLGAPQRVVYGHWTRRQDTAADDSRESWHAATHVLRLARGLDPFEGVGWLIPLGDTVSIGLSVDRDDPDVPSSDAALLDAMLDAWARRGLELRDDFNGPSQQASVPSQRYYLHERAWGRNWLLAGNTFCQVWFGTASGVAAGFAAATVAPRLLRDTQRYGSRYESLLQALTAPHEVFEWLRRVELATKPAGEAQSRGDVLVEQSVVRLLLYTGLQGRPMRHLIGRTLLAAIRRGAVDFADICRGVVASPGEQLRAVEGLAS